MKDLRNYSLKAHNTFGIDAKCSRFLEFEDEEEAMEVAKILRDSDSPYIIIGGGSNLLLTKDFEGIVVRSGWSVVAVRYGTTWWHSVSRKAIMVWRTCR